MSAPEVRSRPAVEFRAVEGEAPGTFEAIVSTFGVIDSYGDRMQPGSFERTLSERGLPPIVWSHEWQVPPVGSTLEARELTGPEVDAFVGREVGTDGGLYVKGRLFVADEDDHAVARQVWAALRNTDGDGRPTLREWSFGFRTRRATYVDVDVAEVPEAAKFGGTLRDVHDVELYEVGPTLIGANPSTHTVAVRAVVAEAVRAGAVSADAARSLLPDADNLVPNSTPPAEVDEQVRARIAQLNALPHPLTY
jgi:uncharacterized protein